MILPFRCLLGVVRADFAGGSCRILGISPDSVRCELDIAMDMLGTCVRRSVDWMRAHHASVHPARSGYRIEQWGNWIARTSSPSAFAREARNHPAARREMRCCRPAAAACTDVYAGHFALSELPKCQGSVLHFVMLGQAVTGSCLCLFLDLQEVAS